MMEKAEKLTIVSIAVGALMLLMYYSKKGLVSASVSDPMAPVGSETNFGADGTNDNPHGTTIPHEFKTQNDNNRKNEKRKLTLNNLLK